VATKGRHRALFAIAGNCFDGLTRDSCTADKGQLRTRRSPGGFEFIGFACRPLFESIGGEIDGPDVVTAFECPVGGEGNLRSVGREAGLAVISMAGGDLAQTTAVGLHRPDVECAAGVGLEGDEIPLRRPAWVRCFGNSVGELRGLAAPDWQGPEQSLQVHDDGLTVGRNGHGEIRAFMDRNPFRLSDRGERCRQKKGNSCELG